MVGSDFGGLDPAAGNPALAAGVQSSITGTLIEVPRALKTDPESSPASAPALPGPEPSKTRQNASKRLRMQLLG